MIINIFSLSFLQAPKSENISLKRLKVTVYISEGKRDIFNGGELIMTEKEKDKEYYKCYSWRLKNFISAHNVYPISSGVHPVTNKVFHIYEMTDELSKILTNWSNNR